jgi:hypothetical protein
MEGNNLNTNEDLHNNHMNTNSDTHENQESNRGVNCLMLILLCIAIVLVFIDFLELYNLFLSWRVSVNLPLFESCLKYELISRTIFSAFSFLCALSALLLTIFIIINTLWFAEKALSSYLYFNYLMFGPYMFGFSLLGFIFWSDVVYVCDRVNPNPDNKILSPGNLFSLITCFIISFSLTIAFSVYKTITIYIDSAMRRPDGNMALRKLFWWFVLRNRDPIELVRQAQEQNYNRENNNNRASQV